MITFIIGLIVGFLISSARFAFALKRDPAQFLDFIKTTEEKKKNKESCCVYIEEENGSFFAYSLPKNTYEGMASSEDELIELLCDKYPTHDIEIMHFEK